MKLDEVFVCALPQSAIKAGDARVAKRWYGAAMQPGPSGRAYLLPHPITPESFEEFLGYVGDNPKLKFLIQFSLVGLLDWHGPKYPKNLILPGLLLRRLNPTMPPRVIVAGGRDYTDSKVVYREIDRFLKEHPDAEIVSGMCRGPDIMGKEYAEEHGVPCEKMPALWDLYDKPAGFVRNLAMAVYGTHLIAFWNQRSKGTGNMIDIARANGLSVVVIKYPEVG